MVSNLDGPSIIKNKKPQWENALEYGKYVEVPYTENEYKPIPNIKVNGEKLFSNENGTQRVLLEKVVKNFEYLGILNYLPSDNFTNKIVLIDQNSLSKYKFDGLITFIPIVDTLMVVDSYEFGKKSKSFNATSKYKSNGFRYVSCELWETCTYWYQCDKYYGCRYTNTSNCTSYYKCEEVNEGAGTPSSPTSPGSSPPSPKLDIPNIDHPRGICGTNYHFYDNQYAYIGTFSNLGYTMIYAGNPPQVPIWSYYGDVCITIPYTSNYLSQSQAVSALKESYYNALITTEASLNNGSIGKNALTRENEVRIFFKKQFESNLGSYAPGSSIGSLGCSGNIPRNSLEYCITKID